MMQKQGDISIYITVPSIFAVSQARSGLGFEGNSLHFLLLRDLILQKQGLG